MSVPIRLPWTSSPVVAGDQPDAGAGVARDDVPGTCPGPADRDAGRVADDHPEESRCPGRWYRSCRCRSGCPGSRRPVAAAPVIDTPACALRRDHVAGACAVPPMVVPGAASTDTPMPALPSGCVPVWSMPM